MMRILSLLSALLTVLFAPQDNTPPTLRLILPKQVKPGAKLQAVVEITFAEGLHGYQNPPAEDYQIPVKVVMTAKGFTVGKPTYPKGVLLSMGGDPKPTAVYDGTIKVPVALVAPKKAGTTVITAVVSYQQCNQSACFPPANVSVVGKLLIKK